MTATNNEFFYWMSIALMMLIHAGFLAYEVGASRSKNVLATAMKNLLAFATIIASFFFVGWFLYNAMPSGFIEMTDAAKAALPWSDNMGPNIDDPASGIFWGPSRCSQPRPARSCPAPSSSAFAPAPS